MSDSLISKAFVGLILVSVVLVGWLLLLVSSFFVCFVIFELIFLEIYLCRISSGVGIDFFHQGCIGRFPFKIAV